MVILGHWSLLLHGVLLKATWVPGQGCVITETDNKLLAITFIYGMAFDFTVLMLTAWKLVFSAPSAVRIGRSMLVTLIFGDGLIYFVVAFLSNLLATVRPSLYPAWLTSHFSLDLHAAQPQCCHVHYRQCSCCRCFHCTF